MPLSMQQKKSTVELLAIIFNDNEFLRRAHAVNTKTIKLTEDLMSNLNYCNNATTALLTGIRCLPKSKNVYGWLLGCLPAILNVFKANKPNSNQIYFAQHM